MNLRERIKRVRREYHDLSAGRIKIEGEAPMAEAEAERWVEREESHLRSQMGFPLL